MLILLAGQVPNLINATAPVFPRFVGEKKEERNFTPSPSGKCLFTATLQP